MVAIPPHPPPPLLPLPLPPPHSTSLYMCYVADLHVTGDWVVSPPLLPPPPSPFPFSALPPTPIRIKLTSLANCLSRVVSEVSEREREWVHQRREDASTCSRDKDGHRQSHRHRVTACMGGECISQHVHVLYMLRIILSINPSGTRDVYAVLH